MKKLTNTKYEGLINANYHLLDLKEPSTYIRITAAKRTARALSGAKLPDVQLILRTFATAGTDKSKGVLSLELMMDWTKSFVIMLILTMIQKYKSQIEQNVVQLNKIFIFF